MKLHTNLKIFLVLTFSIISIVGFMLKLPSAFSHYDKVLHASFYFFAAAFLNILFTKGKLIIHCLIFSILYVFGIAIEFAQEYSNRFFHKRIHGRFDPEDIRHNLKGLLTFSVIWICFTIISMVFKKIKSIE
jgi:hypothetical protein